MAFPNDHRTKSFFNRPQSFSLVHFEGAVQTDIPPLLVRCGYRCLAEARFTAPFMAAYAELAYPELPHIASPDNTIVHKGCYTVPRGAVLLDPETVIGSLYLEQLQEFCAIKLRSCHCRFVGTRVRKRRTHQDWAFWRRDTDVPHPGRNQRASKPRLILRCLRNPLAGDSFNAWMALGIPIQEVFGEIEVWGFKLDRATV